MNTFAQELDRKSCTFYAGERVWHNATATMAHVDTHIDTQRQMYRHLAYTPLSRKMHQRFARLYIHTAICVYINQCIIFVGVTIHTEHTASGNITYVSLIHQLQMDCIQIDNSRCSHWSHEMNARTRFILLLLH